MNRTIYSIEIRSLKQCVEHLRVVDLDELAARAEEFGTESERALIVAVRDCLTRLPPTHP